MHEPVCQELETCKASFVAQAADQKLEHTWVKLLPPSGQRPESSPLPSVLGLVSALDGDGLTDDMKLGFLNAPIYAMKL